MICHCASQLPLHADEPLTLPELLPWLGPAARTLCLGVITAISSCPWIWPALTLPPGAGRQLSFTLHQKARWQFKTPAPGKWMLSVRSSSSPSPETPAQAAQQSRTVPGGGCSKSLFKAPLWSTAEAGKGANCLITRTLLESSAPPCSAPC